MILKLVEGPHSAKFNLSHDETIVHPPAPAPPAAAAFV